jgi:hypothetical protein
VSPSLPPQAASSTDVPRMAQAARKHRRFVIELMGGKRRFMVVK